MLDERGVEYEGGERSLRWRDRYGIMMQAFPLADGELGMDVWSCTPAQAVEATLGREPWVSPTWERWHKSLRHDEIKSIGDAVEQLMYEAIEFGGDMGPNGNTYNDIDEGDVLTSGFINEWIARFESTLGRDRYSYEQWREISNAVGDAMEYAHDRAIEHPDRADPLWNLDEYVNRILKVAFEGEATLGRGTCHDTEGSGRDFCCSACGARLYVDTGDTFTMIAADEHTIIKRPNFCPNCGAEVVSE